MLKCKLEMGYTEVFNERLILFKYKSTKELPVLNLHIVQDIKLKYNILLREN